MCFSTQGCRIKQILKILLRIESNITERINVIKSYPLSFFLSYYSAQKDVPHVEQRFIVFNFDQNVTRFLSHFNYSLPSR